MTSNVFKDENTGYNNAKVAATGKLTGSRVRATSAEKGWSVPDGSVLRTGHVGELRELTIFGLSSLVKSMSLSYNESQRVLRVHGCVWVALVAG